MPKGNFKRDFNMCLNWCLYCTEMITIQNGDGVRLSCILNGQKKQDGTYPKGVPVSVICIFEDCIIEPDDYAGKYVDVYGGITATEYSTQSGEKKSGLTLFADKVSVHNWNDKKANKRS